MSVNITSPYLQDRLAQALQSTDPHAADNWIVGQPGNTHARELYTVAKQYGMQSPQYQQALAQADAQFKAGPGGILGVLNKISGPAVLGIAGAVTGGALGLGPLAGGGAAGPGSNSLPPSAGSLPAAPSVGGTLSGVAKPSGLDKYLPLALAGAGMLSSASASGQASRYLDQALQASEGDYAARAPLRSAGIAGLAGLPNAQQLQTALANPSNPFAHPVLPPPPMFTPAPAGSPQGVANVAQKMRLAQGPALPSPLPSPAGFQRPTLSIGPDGLPLPPRGV